MTFECTLDHMPILARVLVASRLVRRRVLGQPPGPGRDAELRALDGIDTAIRDGHTGLRETNGLQSGIHTLTRALAVCRLEPLDSGDVTRLVREAIRFVGDDPWVSSLQVAILLSADIDQIRYACGELRLGERDPLTDSVFLRLAPVHALTLIEPRPTPEEEAR